MLLPIPFKDLNSNSASVVLAPVAPLFLIKANQDASFFSKYELSIKPVNCMSVVKVACQESSLSKFIGK